jgi:hypothetical protein
MWLSPFDYHCVILDGALPGVKELWYAYAGDIDSTEYLYAKTSYTSMLEASPLIGKTSYDDPFLPKLYEAATTGRIKGTNWGCLLHTDASPEKLAVHFRRWISIYDDIGEEVFFRFYDPDILPHFAAALEGNERQVFFGPVKAFMCRQKDTDLLAASVANRPPDYDLEAALRDVPDRAPWFSLQEKHIAAMNTFFMGFLIDEVLRRLPDRVTQHIPSREHRRLKIRECLIALKTINNDILPEPDEGAIFCLIAMTSCSHFYNSPVFMQAIRRNGISETLDEWRRYAYGTIPGLEYLHDKQWLNSQHIEDV